MIYEDAQRPERGGGGMMRPQWLIVAPRVLRQMELLSLLLFSRELASFLKPPLHISVGNGLPNFPTLSPCISYVHINESSGGFWTRRRVGGLLYGRAMQVGRWRFYWSFFAVGQQKKQHTFLCFHSPGFKLVWVCVLAFKRRSFPLKLKMQTWLSSIKPSMQTSYVNSAQLRRWFRSLDMSTLAPHMAAILLSHSPTVLVGGGGSKYWCTFCFPLSLGPSGAAAVSGERTSWKKLSSIQRCCPSPPSTWLAYTKPPWGCVATIPSPCASHKVFFSFLPVNSSLAHVSCPRFPSHTGWIMNKRCGTTDALLLHRALCPERDDTVT